MSPHRSRSAKIMAATLFAGAIVAAVYGLIEVFPI